VPQHLSIVGFDNIEPTLYVDPPLTTVAQPLLTLGREAMNMTLDLLEQKPVYDKILPCELLARHSTAPPG
jgi:DNA-binding LacI/PurR family transcriptional regulator